MGKFEEYSSTYAHLVKPEFRIGWKKQ
jgi:hypothetical protein